MAVINKTGITNGGTIQAEHVTRVIDALSGVSTDTLIISGTMTGSLIGSLTGTASFATTASFALNGGNGAAFPFTGSARITGSLIVTGSTTLSGSTTISGTPNLQGTTGTTNWIANKNAVIDWSDAGNPGNGTLVLPMGETSSPRLGSVYFTEGDPSYINIWDGSMWRQFASV